MAPPKTVAKPKAARTTQDGTEIEPLQEARLRQDVEITPRKLSRRQDVAVNSARLLDTMHWMFAQYGRWPSPASLDLAVLWAASTHFRDVHGNLVFAAHPRLFFIAPKGSGKSRLMEEVGSVCHDWTGLVDTMVTAPGLREALYHGMTITLDEFDREIGSGRANMEIQKFVAAYKESSGSLDARGGGLNQQSSFGAMMLGAKERILTATGGWVDDLFERSFIITPERSPEKIPHMDGEYEKLSAAIRNGLAWWGESERPDDPKEKLWPIHDVPEKLTGRQLEISEALFAVADRAIDPEKIANEGSDVRWAIRARDAAEAVLVGHGDSAPEIMDDIAAQLAAMGVEL